VSTATSFSAQIATGKRGVRFAGSEQHFWVGPVGIEPTTKGL